MIKETTNKSEGKCLFCDKTYTKTTINRHLQTHLRQKVQKNKSGQSYLIKVEQHPKWSVEPYFISLWVDGCATMEDIDVFLRRIWLECCGHLSSFTDPRNRRRSNMWTFFEGETLLIQGKRKAYEKFLEEETGRIPMSRKVNEVFSKGLKLDYEYDAGSPIELLLLVMEEYPARADENIVLLSRNEPLELWCDTCKTEPATQFCIVHDWNEDRIFCDKCAKKHAKKCVHFNDYAAMPVVNSPRMGVCGYSGGSIDTERDGVFAKKS
jgi:hypothetical protein